MKNIKKIITVALISMLTASLGGCKMISKTPEAIKKSPVAKVSSKTVTKADFDEKMNPIIDQIKAQYGEDFDKNDQGKALLEDQKKKVLDYLVNLNMFTIKNEKLNIISNEDLNKEIDKRYDEIKAAYGDDAKLEEAMKQEGLTQETLKAYLKENIIYSKVQDYIVKDVTVDDSKINQFYEDNKATMFTQKAGANLAHIIIQTEDEAKNIKARIDKGEDFGKIADEINTDATKGRGGDLGFVEYDTPNYDKDFMAGAKDLKEGEVSGPVKSSFGYHLIKATKVQKEDKVKSFDEVKDQAKEQALEKEKESVYNKTIDDWKKELKVKTYEKNL